MKTVLPGLALLLAVGCGSSPPPKVEEPSKEESHSQSAGPKLAMSQELGSIDQRKVEQTFSNLVNGPLENCHKQGRDRVEYLTGDVKVFLRVDGNGRVKYGYFEDSTIGDRETEKCILGIFNGTSWPKPEGGEAEVRSGFGWGPGGEREPTTWSSDKVATALVESKDVKKDVDKCKAGIKGDFRVTAYVEPTDEHSELASEASDAKAKPGKPKPPPPKAGKHGAKESGGRFKAIGMAAPNKEGAEKIDCLVDALKGLDLPSPGSYAAKVTFSL
ncbi:MAG: hypothetical protein JWP87_2108 [Labilithrix sp.]|nr:hypothetical protein [Labilithrix sp.]